jgi:dynein heavy chain
LCFQALLLVNTHSPSSLQLLSLWLHENSRVFEDRLTCSEDHAWFRQHQVELLHKHFGLEYGQVVNQERLIYGDYLVPGAEPKVRRR